MSSLPAGTLATSAVPLRSDTVLVTTIGYDAAGWVQSVTDPRGLVDQQTHDALDRLTQDVQDFTNGVPTTDSNRTTQYTYDGEKSKGSGSFKPAG